MDHMRDYKPERPHPDNTDILNNRRGDGTPLSLRALDSPSGAFRHAAFIETRFLGVHITRGNAESILQTFRTEQGSIKFTRDLLHYFYDAQPVMITRGTIDALEKIWTGGIRHTADPLSTKTKFFVQIEYRTWLTAEWSQVRELSYIAVSEDGLDVLIRESGLKYGVWEARDSAILVEQNVVENRINCLHDASIRFNLRAAISRVALSLVGVRPVKGAVGESNSIGLIQEKRVISVHQMAQQLYEQHKNGRQKPLDHYIQQSVRNDFQTLEKSPRSTLDHPFPAPGTLSVNEDGLVLVVGDCNAQNIKPPKVCVYMVSGPPIIQPALALWVAISKMVEENKRIHTSPRYSVATDPWTLLRNVKDVYISIKSEFADDIQDWLSHLAQISIDLTEIDETLVNEYSKKLRAFNLSTVSASKLSSPSLDAMGNVLDQRLRSASQVSDGNCSSYSPKKRKIQDIMNEAVAVVDQDQISLRGRDRESSLSREDNNLTRGSSTDKSISSRSSFPESRPSNHLPPIDDCVPSNAVVKYDMQPNSVCIHDRKLIASSAYNAHSEIPLYDFPSALVRHSTDEETARPRKIRRTPHHENGCISQTTSRTSFFRSPLALLRDYYRRS